MVMKLLGSLLITLAIAATALGAQVEVQGIQAPVPFVQLTGQQRLLSDLDAYRTRQEFQLLLRRYAPSLVEVFRIDPSLLSNQAFLAPYPNLAAFLNQHPEITHNPSFFVGRGPEYFDNRANNRSSENFKDVLAGIAIFAAGLVLLSVTFWTIKNVIDHRRWLRISKVQSEVHSKLLDRFTSNQDLLAYVQTPAGRHFLESAPISLDGPRSLSAPFGRILFSVQAGVVLALTGIGLNWVSRSVQEDLAQPLFVVGVLALSVGVGFVLSAGIAYVMSQRLGLLTPNPLTSTSTNPGASPPHA